MRLSIVYSVHDPAYGAGPGTNLVQRMQVSLNVLAELARLCELDFEVVVVEWAPPAERSKIRSSVSWPKYQTGRLRFIEVPMTIHKRLDNWEVMPLFEYIGKNVGIRRAGGGWILATTPDVLFNEALVRFFAAGSFDENAFYRIDRQDTSARLDPADGWRKQLTLSARSITQVNTSLGSFPPDKVPQGQRPEYPLHTNASGDFFLMSRSNWFRLRGYPELSTHAHIDSIMCWTAKSYGLEQLVLGTNMRLYHQEHDRSLHATLPLTDWRPWQDQFLAAISAREPMKVRNSENWDFALDDLPEYSL